MITSVNNLKIKHVINLLKHSKLRREEKLFVTEGLRIFEETPDDIIKECFVTERFYGEYTDKGRLKSLPLEIVAEDVFKKMSDTVCPQGVLTVVKAKTYSYNPEETEKALMLLLEDIQDPGNLGTLIRTAEGAGVSMVVMSKGTVDIFSPKVIRSTMGAIFRVPFMYVESMPDFEAELKKADISVYAAALNEQCDYTGADYTKPCAILIGNEGNGLSKEAIENAGETVTIPMCGKVESLNAAVSGAIIMYEANRQRRN